MKHLLNVGAVYLFENHQNSWTQTTLIRTHEIAAGDFFGEAVAFYDESIMVGALDDDHGVDSGKTILLL